LINTLPGVTTLEPVVAFAAVAFEAAMFAAGRGDSMEIEAGECDEAEEAGAAAGADPPPLGISRVRATFSVGFVRDSI
jgi:hypothetical protein